MGAAAGCNCNGGLVLGLGLGLGHLLSGGEGLFFWFPGDYPELAPSNPGAALMLPHRASSCIRDEWRDR